MYDQRHRTNGSHEALSVLFGPQGTMTPTEMLELRAFVQEHPDLHFVAETLSGLQAIWPALLGVLPQLDRLPGEKMLTEISHFFNGGTLPRLCGSPLNVLVSPLTVASHVVDFWKLSHGLDGRLSNEIYIGDVQGFCLGFLTAAAVSGSRDAAQFQKWASNAVRLALCMGALVDLDAIPETDRLECASALAVRWRTTAELQYLHDTLRIYPKGYISCVTDPKTATITLPGHQLDSFMADLAKRNVLSMQLAPRGRWHNRVNLPGLRAIMALCEQDERFTLPDAGALNSALVSNITGETIAHGAIHSLALHSILTDQSRWDRMFDTLRQAMKEKKTNFRYITLGERVNVPRTTSEADSMGPSPDILNDIPDQEVDNRDLGASAHTPFVPSTMALEDPDLIPDSAIAVIGMACRYPGADTIEEFWNLISEGTCVIQQIPKDRFKPSELVREPKGPFWGGYVRRLDLFDHRFFGISGREAKYMDPQQRLCLQVAYEAMESAGYYGLHSDGFDKEIGCYIGSANDDYFDNVTSHPVSAFSLTGTLRSFISGRVSHCLGWAGPSMVMDTACSAAAVAIHTACQALQTKDCSVAVAGGICSMSSSRMTQNLIGAGFLSPTGPSKAFDVNADGYCRAEGAGIVVLKPLREAVRNGDFVLGVITGSAVNQGGNASSIIVPDGQSQHAVYQKALARSGTAATDVTYVEAHGTGTQVGDPIEFKSIRETFGGLHRPDDVYVGSVKDNIGHTEASSGVASLIKTLLMMQYKTIPKLANFRQLNPKIEPLGKDHVLIPTRSHEWKATKRVALINNYGAGGNNAAMVVEERSRPPTARVKLSHFPIFISGKSTEAIQSYCEVLKASLTGKDLGDVAYNLAIKQNRDFENTLTLVSTSNQDLANQLEGAASGTVELQKIPTQTPCVVLCFGGQDGKIAHVSKFIYDNSVLLQKHLAECDLVLTQQLSLPSLFPTIFDPEPIHDIVALHSVLFAIQYSCAKCWLDCGVKIDRIIGHSFGQLTALCISGSLSLLDALRVVSERAKLMVTHCSPTNGIMLAVEGDKAQVDDLLALAKHQSQGFTAEIACFNGPRSFVIAGNQASIRAVEKAAQSLPSRIRFKYLENSHAFHSQLLDPILPELLQVTSGLHLSPPAIPIEACSNDDDWTTITAEKVVRHTRMAVYFLDAVRRVERRLKGPIIWLEAGTGSPIIPMVKRAVMADQQQHIYISTALRSAEAPVNLAQATCRLWTNGVRVQFWSFHRSQHSYYNWINLPPYQFAKVSHWLEYKPRKIIETPEDDLAPVSPPRDLVTLVSSQNGQGEALFEIYPAHELYQLNTKGHEVVDQTLVPASLYNEFVLTASRMLSNAQNDYVPHISNLSMSSPLVVNPVGQVFVRLVAQIAQPGAWEFTLFTQIERTNPLTHATGRITVFNPSVPDSIRHLQTLQSLMLARCNQIEGSPKSIGFKGPTAYQAMRRVVTYLDYYHGIHSIYNLGNEATAYISLPPVRPKGMGVGFCDPVLIDSFTQVSGILANCFSLPEDGEMWVCNYINDVVFTQRFVDTARDENKAWRAYSKYEIPSPKRLTCNIFVFDPVTGDIVLTIMSIEFQKVSIKSLKKVLGKLNSQAKCITLGKTDPLNATSVLRTLPIQEARTENQSRLPRTHLAAPVVSVPEDTNQTLERTGATKGTKIPLRSLQRVKEMLRDVLEVPLEEIRSESGLEELGVDSLLATEIFSEVSKRFGVSVSHAEFATAANVRGLSRIISGSEEVSVSSPVSLGTSTPRSIPAPTTTVPERPPVLYQAGLGATQPVVKVTEMLADILEIPIGEISSSSNLEELGVDSLLATELFSELNKRFGVFISHTDFATITDVQGLARLVSGSGPSDAIALTPPPHSHSAKPAKGPASFDVETVVFAERDGIRLSADIYYPEGLGNSQRPLAVALMIHGGGHVISTRTDIRHDQTQILLNAGFLPVSIDYRLCPELPIHKGAMQDVRDAFYWARKTLPTLPLRRSDIRPDGDRVVAIGWSSGGHLAMTLGWTASPLGIAPPEAILGFYCPTDYEDPFWALPNLPFGQQPIELPGPGYDFLYDGLCDNPIVGYIPQASRRALLGGWMSLEDPRSRIILHMNWEGKSLPVLINGLQRHAGTRTVTRPSFPSVEQIQAISPLAQIRQGHYRTPTFLIHGTRDDLVPWQSSKRTSEALQAMGVVTELVILEDAVHLFDLYPSSKKSPEAVKGVNEGYDFLRAHVQV